MKWKAWLLSILLLPAPALPDQSQCYNEKWKTVEYDHPSRGRIVIYQTPKNYNITTTNLACIVSVQFLKKRKNMPTSMLVGLISVDYRRAFLAQWSVKYNRFVIMETNIPYQEYRSNGLFISYPEPLERLKEIMIVKKFPTRAQLPEHLRHRFRVNYVPTSVMQLKSLVTDGDK